MLFSISIREFSNKFTFIFLLLILLISLGIFAGCDKKETPEEDTSMEETLTMPDTVITDTSAAAPQDSLSNLTGTWTGTFDQRAATLKITEQNDNEFKGVITINYREVINQTVSGSIDPEKSTINMQDLVHSRFMGKYNGKLSEEGKKISGTFTMNLDNSKFNFSLTKK